MWSESLPFEQLKSLVAVIRAILPAPSPTAAGFRQKLHFPAGIGEFAEKLCGDRGFAYVRRTAPNGESIPLLFREPLATVTYWDGYAIVSGPGGTRRVLGRGFDILQAVLEAWNGPADAFLTGFLSYDLAAELEDLGPFPDAGFRFPQFSFGLFDSHFVLENGTWFLCGTDAWRTAHLRTAADDLLMQTVRNVSSEVDAFPEPAVSGGSLISNPDREAFENSVQAIVATIHSGDIFQTNLCRRITAPLRPGLEWALFQNMRQVSPSRYEAFLRAHADGGPATVLSISPELFLKVDNGVVTSSPIKGTRPRSSNRHADDELAAELLASEKDRAELAMIVDVVRNDLGRVCEIGSVKVKNHAELMTLPTVHHSVSHVTGCLRQEAGVTDLLRAAFPAASISGAPKIEAMRVAMREEGQRRGPCMGAIGWFSLDGSLELSVAIRTAFAAEGSVHYYGGCGITAGSVPSQEFAESRHKIAAFVRALGMERNEHW